MPRVEKTTGGRVYVRPLDRAFEIGDTAEVSDEEATYLVEERGDFAYLDKAESDAEDDDDANTVDEDICGYEKDDGSLCQRDAGWGRNADTGPCKDHVDEEE